MSTSFLHVSLKIIINPGTVDHRGQLTFRDAYLQCFSREPAHAIAANWILSSWYTDNSSFPKDTRKMQKLWTAQRSRKSDTQKPC